MESDSTSDKQDAGVPAEVVVEDSHPHSDDPLIQARGGELRIRTTASQSMQFYYDAQGAERRKTIYRLNRGRRDELIKSE